MKKYSGERTVRFVLTEEQKAWLRSKATGMKTMSQVLRELIDKAIQESR
ncbi:MAG: hypothetical protein WBH43_05650 [Aquiluna sp.]|jgi:hypothetical protein